MVKIDFNLVGETASHVNPLREHELTLSALRIPAIENLALTRDMNDTINLNSNAIPSLTNFPRMTRLTTLLLAENRISRLDKEVPNYLPNLDTLILTGNKIESLSEVDALSGFKKLQYLSLIDVYANALVSNLLESRVKDFTRIKDKERLAARKLFAKSAELESEDATAARSGTFSLKEAEELKARQQRKAALKEKIANAKTLDEISRLERQLQDEDL